MYSNQAPGVSVGLIQSQLMGMGLCPCVCPPRIRYGYINLKHFVKSSIDETITGMNF